MKCILFDTQQIVSGDTRAEFFRNAPPENSVDSITRIHEPQIVRWLVGNDSPRSLLLEALGMPDDAHCRTEVTDPFLGRKRSELGDIDLLICPRDRPHQAIAIEWKRVKSTVSRYNQDKPNKIDAAKKAIGQVKDLHGLGFSQTYIGVVAVADGQSAEDTNFAFRGLSNETRGRLERVLDSLRPPDGVGVVYMEIIQPTRKPIDEAAMICIAQLRQPVLREQPEQLTTLVYNFMRTQAQ